MRESQIRAWVEALTNSFGKARVSAGDEPFRALHAVGDYTAMAALIKEQLRLGTKMRLGRVKSSGFAQKVCWADRPNDMPMYGSPVFHDTVVTLYIKESFLKRAPHGAVVVAMAHEMSRVILDAIRHSLRDRAEAADLAAMLLGYRDFFVNDAFYEKAARCPDNPTTAHGDMPNFSFFEDLFAGFGFSGQPVAGYLTREEREYAALLMRD